MQLFADHKFRMLLKLSNTVDADTFSLAELAKFDPPRPFDSFAAEESTKLESLKSDRAMWRDQSEQYSYSKHKQHNLYSGKNP